jgi:hypothetical protein
VAESRQHVPREQLDVLQRQLVAHRPDVQEHHQVSDAQLPDRLLELLAHGGRAPGDDQPVVDKILE